MTDGAGLHSHAPVTSRDHPSLPILAVLVSLFLYGVMDGFIKAAGTTIGVYNVMLWRTLFSILLTWPLWRASGGKWPNSRAMRLHVIRGTVAAAMAYLFFWGLVRTPMAQAMAISFIAPLIALYLAAVLLRERVAPRAIVGSLLGLGGVMVIAVPRMHEQGLGGEAMWGVLAVLGSAVLYAWNLILQRQQAQVADPREIAFFQNGMMFILFALGSPWLGIVPPRQEMGWIIAAAVLAISSLMLFSWAYARAEAQALVPLEYAAFISAALIGWLWFGEVLTAQTLAGVALVVAGTWIAGRKTRSQSTEQTQL